MQAPQPPSPAPPPLAWPEALGAAALLLAVYALGPPWLAYPLTFFALGLAAGAAYDSSLGRLAEAGQVLAVSVGIAITPVLSLATIAALLEFRRVLIASPERDLAWLQGPPAIFLPMLAFGLGAGCTVLGPELHAWWRGPARAARPELRARRA